MTFATSHTIHLPFIPMNNHNNIPCGYYQNRNNSRLYNRSPELGTERSCPNQNFQSSMEFRARPQPPHHINFRENDLRENLVSRRVNLTKPSAYDQHGMHQVIYNRPTHYPSNQNSYFTKKLVDMGSLGPSDEPILSYQRPNEIRMNLNSRRNHCGPKILKEQSPSVTRSNHLDIYRRLPELQKDGQNKRKRIDIVGLRHINHSKNFVKADANEHKKKKVCVYEKPKKKAEELDAASILCSFSKIRPNSAPQDERRNTDRSPCLQIPACVSLDEVVPDKTKLHREKSESVLECSSSNESGTSKCPTRLAMCDDKKELNSLHRFVRSDLLELFIQHDTGKSAEPERLCSENNSRVGLRCVFCAINQPKPAIIYLDNDKKCPVLDPKPIIDNFNAPMSTFYPKSLRDIYRLVCTWQRVHFNKCKNVPPSVQAMYKDLKNNDKTRGKTKYWTSSAEALGLVNDDRNGGFIRYVSKTTQGHQADS